jgi:hypothetical protein
MMLLLLILPTTTNMYVNLNVICIPEAVHVLYAYFKCVEIFDLQ